MNYWRGRGDLVGRGDGLVACIERCWADPEGLPGHPYERTADLSAPSCGRPATDRDGLCDEHRAEIRGIYTARPA